MNKLQSKLRDAVREAGDAKDEAEVKSVRRGTACGIMGLRAMGYKGVPYMEHMPWAHPFLRFTSMSRVFRMIGWCSL